MEIKPGLLLSNINTPDDLKTLTREQLHQVCDELRQYIIDVVSVHGGHFAASLGVDTVPVCCFIDVVHRARPRTSRRGIEIRHFLLPSGI